MTTAVDLIDDNNSNDNNESETPSLMDQESSDDKDSDGNDNDDADGDENVFNHTLVSENSNSGRQETVNQDDEDIINHISVAENTKLGRQETVNPDTNVNVTPWGRTQIVSPATAGITSTAVEQLARGHTFDNKGRQRTTQASKKPKNYEVSYTNKKYTEGTINIDYMRENEPMKDFIIQDQIEHVLGVAMAQVYSLKKGLKEFSQDEKM